MQKKHNPVDKLVFPGRTFPLELTIKRQETANRPLANSSRKGKLSYLTKAWKAEQHGPASKNKPNILTERIPYGRGNYIGYDGKVTAFVWNEGENEAANDGKYAE